MLLLTITNMHISTVYTRNTMHSDSLKVASSSLPFHSFTNYIIRRGLRNCLTLSKIWVHPNCALNYKDGFPQIHKAMRWREAAASFLTTSGLIRIYSLDTPLRIAHATSPNLEEEHSFGGDNYSPLWMPTRGMTQIAVPSPSASSTLNPATTNLICFITNTNNLS